MMIQVFFIVSGYRHGNWRQFVRNWPAVDCRARQRGGPGPMGEGVEMAEKLTYDEFWPLYLKAHGRRSCRILHYIGTGMGVLGVVLLLLSGIFWLVPAIIVAGYGFAWTGHYLFEQGNPLSFSHPLLSLRSDLRMCWRAMIGALGRDLREAVPQQA